jgi:hypothetical protein
MDQKDVKDYILMVNPRDSGSNMMRKVTLVQSSNI